MYLRFFSNKSLLCTFVPSKKFKKTPRVSSKKKYCVLRENFDTPCKVLYVRKSNECPEK